MATPDFFIMGTERSGTTLLSALLSQHPDVFVLNDSFVYRVFNDFSTPKLEQVVRKGSARLIPRSLTHAWAQASHLPKAGDTVPAEAVAGFVRHLKAWFAKQGSDHWLRVYGDRLDVDQLIAVTGGGQVEATRFFGAVLHQMMTPAQREKPILGEKTPQHFDLAPDLRTLYPDARWILNIRNPFTNIAAIYRREHARTLQVAVAMYMSRWHRRFAALHDNDEVLVVRYEDLVADPDSTLAAVWDHLGVTPVTASTRFSYDVRGDYIGNAIDPERDARLMDVLSTDDRAQIARHCCRVLARHYPELAVQASER